MLSTHDDTDASSTRTRQRAPEAMARVVKAVLVASFAILSGGHAFAGEAADGPFLKDGMVNERNTRHGSFYARSQHCEDVFTPLIENVWCAKTTADPVV